MGKTDKWQIRMLAQGALAWLLLVTMVGQSPASDAPQRTSSPAAIKSSKRFVSWQGIE